MKKILPYILMVLIFANIFAPLSVGVDSKNIPEIKTNQAEAGGGVFFIQISPSSGDYANVVGTYQFTGTPNQTHSKLYGGTDQANLVALPFTNQTSGGVTLVPNTQNVYIYSFNYKYTGLTPGTVYYVQIEISSATAVIEKSGVQSFTSGGSGVIVSTDVTVILSNAQKAFDDCKAAHTATEIQNGACHDQEVALQSAQDKLLASKKTSSSDVMPDCVFAHPIDGTFVGCIAQAAYYVLFVPTSYVFALTGKFFDFTFSYSVNDNSYRSPFVVSGWGLVRDFCNIFFIFVLLYIAFSTILSIHGFKTKEMIINVVIIGLLINFSLFAARVVVDTSNILARVFYNPQVIVTGDAKDKDGNVVSKLGENDEIQLSAAIVSKINPQELISNAKQVNDISTNKGQVVQGHTDSITAGSFLLIVLLATVVNVIGIIVFISLGMMCVTRVVGLWLYMIFAPLAFFSYTVPGMKGLKMIGWKNWWSQLLCYSFWAPLLIFFLYLIIKFLDNGLGLIHASGQTGVAFVIAIVVPFAFIMILLWKAKTLAKSMGCEMAEQITGGIAAVGGLALGGAALGGAALLRNTVGSTAKYIQNSGARQKDSLKNYSNWSLGKKLNPFSYGKAAVAGVAKQAFKIPAGGGKTLGDKMQQADRGFSEKTHATQILNDKMQSEFGHQYGKDAKFKDLTEAEQVIVKKEVDKDEMAKAMYGKKFKDLEAPQAKEIQDRYMGAHIDPDTGLPTGPQRAIADSHGGTARVDHISTVNAAAGEKVKSDSIVDFSKINATTGEFVQALRKGSMDIRNLSQAKAVSKGFPKMAIGLLAAVAAGTRMGIKESGINHGTGQKDFLKDIGHTITEALKSIKVKVDTGHGGGDDHGKEAKSVGH